MMWNQEELEWVAKREEELRTAQLPLDSVKFKMGSLVFRHKLNLALGVLRGLKFGIAVGKFKGTASRIIALYYIDSINYTLDNFVGLGSKNVLTATTAAEEIFNKKFNEKARNKVLINLLISEMRINDSDFTDLIEKNLIGVIHR